MRTIIAGSRDVLSYDEVQRAIAVAVLAHSITPSVVISGGARGVDALGERYARDCSIPVERYPAEWDRYGKSAGYRRNELMAERADALIAVWDGVSRGTGHMIDIARRRGLKVYVHRV